MENRIELEEFLVGGILWKNGSELNEIEIDGFSLLGKDFPFNDEKDNYLEFKKRVKEICQKYCWDTNDCKVVEKEEFEGPEKTYQLFKCPDDTLLMLIYSSQKAFYFKKDVYDWTLEVFIKDNKIFSKKFEIKCEAESFLDHFIADRATINQEKLIMKCRGEWWYV